MPKMIFHHPLTIGPGGDSGSKVRPYRLRTAFQEMGFDVIDVTGTHAQRRETIQTQVYGQPGIAFLYGETTNTPMMLDNRYHLPNILAEDFKLLKYCRGQGIPAGVFYRDIYWVFDYYKQRQSNIKIVYYTPLRYYELFQYRQNLDILFMPTQKMGASIPIAWDPDTIVPLPPGCTPLNIPDHLGTGGDLNLLYVGNITPPLYDLRSLFEMVNRIPGLTLTVSCREEDWRQRGALYADVMSKRIRVVHKSGDELDGLYRNAHVFVTYREHHPYLDITLPIKIFEAWSHGLPLIVRKGGEDARWVDKQQGGWTVKDVADLKKLLIRLRDNREVLHTMRRQVHQLVERNTWERRAEFIAETLVARNK